MFEANGEGHENLPNYDYTKFVRNPQNLLENNFLDVERELSMASEIAGILENRRLSKVRVRRLKNLTCIFIFTASLLFRVWTVDQDLGMAREP